MFGTNPETKPMNFKRGLAGAFGGQQGIAAYDNGQAQQAQTQIKQKQAQSKTEDDAAAKFKSLIGDTVAYVSQLPPDIEQRELGAKAYMQTMGADPEMIGRLESSGYFRDLTDEKLRAFSASMRQEQVLKDKEVLLGRDGEAVYENRYNAPQVVADGSALVGQDGTALFENQKDVAPQQATADMQNFEAAKQAGFKGSFYDYQTGLKQAGRATTSVSVTGDQKLSTGQEAVDKAYASDYLAWKQGGGSDNAKLVSQLDDALEALGSGRNITGKVIGLTPNALTAMFNPEAVDVREKVAEVVQRNLRLVLGAAFTEKEGQQLIARAFNPQLQEEVNEKRVKSLVSQIRSAAESKQDASQYFEKNGTLRGWTGKNYTMADFESAVGGNSNESVDVDSKFSQDADGAYVWTGN